jgi:hypothetical protein
MVRFRFNNPIITNADRIAAGLPPRDLVRTPHESVTERVDFTLDKTVYVALARQNERGLIGQWSVIKSAVIP